PLFPSTTLFRSKDAGSLLGAIAAADFPVQAIEHPLTATLKADFWVGRVDRRGFPLTEWRRIVDAVLRHNLTGQVRYGDPRGDDGLRRAIADHIGPARGVTCRAEDVVVVGGSQDGLMLIGQMLGTRCRTFLHENPCYQGARYLFGQLGHACRPVPVDRDGLVVEALPETRNAVLYVTP